MTEAPHFDRQPIPPGPPVPLNLAADAFRARSMLVHEPSSFAAWASEGRKAQGLNWLLNLMPWGRKG